MIDPKILDDLARRLADSAPEGVKLLKADLEKNFRAALQAVLGKMDLVTREEFDVQKAVLARAQARIAELEAQISAMEKSAGEQV